MPFRSQKQMAYLKHNQPAVYKRWVAVHGKRVVASKSRKKVNQFTEELSHG